MNETARAVLYKALVSAYKQRGIWGQQVYTLVAKAKASRPYVIILAQGGGQVNRTLADDLEPLLTIKCVADDFETAMHGAAKIEELTHNTGAQDRIATGVTALAGSTEWSIIRATKEIEISFVEEYQNSVQIWHEGAQYRFRIERL